jgi:hypothetical protein
VSNDAAKIRMFRERAMEIRKIAKDIGEASCRASLLEMADYYEKLAAALEARRRPDAPTPRRH